VRNGFKVWDTDTHLQPTLESLEPYYDPAFREQVQALERYRAEVEPDPTVTPRPEEGRHVYRVPGRLSFQRILGQAEPSPTRLHNYGKFMGAKYPAVGCADDQVDARIRDMDEEGVDVQLMIHGLPANITLLNEPELEVGFNRAANRLVDDLCSRHPGRLQAILAVSSKAIEASVEEIRTWGAKRWAAGVWPIPDLDTPLDHPKFEPIWRAAADMDLPVIHHSVAWIAPYFPGYRDMWDNQLLARACSHPWGAMRAITAFIGAGVMDRYPTLRFGILESGCGWLPFWARHLDDQVEYVGTTAPLRHKISEYMTGGRFFASIEMHEGEDMIKMVMDFLGEDVLMYASDYPHPECLFPGSVDHFLGWSSLDARLKQKLLWENPVRFFGEP
jgi:uncharacterized protein